jgi:hypothetical protein
MTLTYAVLRDPSHVLPMPGSPGVIFPVEGRLIDLSLPLWQQLIADGSLVEAAPPATEPEPAPSTRRR